MIVGFFLTMIFMVFVMYSLGVSITSTVYFGRIAARIKEDEDAIIAAGGDPATTDNTLADKVGFSHATATALYGINIAATSVCGLMILIVFIKVIFSYVIKLVSQFGPHFPSRRGGGHGGLATTPTTVMRP